MKILSLSIYSFLLWLFFQFITLLFLTQSFFYEMTLLKVVTSLIGGMILSYLFVFIVNYLKMNKYVLILVSSFIFLILEMASSVFVLDPFNILHLFLSNFLYSFIIISSLRA